MILRCHLSVWNGGRSVQLLQEWIDRQLRAKGGNVTDGTGMG